jgi:hypothetical protein
LRLCLWFNFEVVCTGWVVSSTLSCHSFSLITLVQRCCLLYRIHLHLLSRLICVTILRLLLLWFASIGGCFTHCFFLFIKLPDTNDVESIYDEIRLNVKVKRRIKPKWRWQIDFKYPWLQIRVKNYIEAKNIKAIWFYRPSSTILHLLNCPNYLSLDTDQRLYYWIINASPNCLHIYPKSFKMRLECRERPFITEISLR